MPFYYAAQGIIKITRFWFKATHDDVHTISKYQNLYMLGGTKNTFTLVTSLK